MTFTHAIITRYNVCLYSGNPYRVRDAEAWMQARWDLFEETAASVASQALREEVDRPVWLFCLDPATPLRWEERLRASAPYVFIIYCDTLGIRHEGRLQKTLRDLTYHLNTEWLLTTRLDNDDRLLPGFLEAVQAEARRRVMDSSGKPLKGSRRFVIDTHGYKRYLGNGERVKDRRNRANSTFLSLLEPVTAAPFHTCYARPHSVMPDDYPAVKLPDFGYEMVIHGQNQMNR